MRDDRVSVNLYCTILLSDLGDHHGIGEHRIIGYETAAALVLGENIGTTITAYLASLGATSKNAKRAAYAHIVFNILGVLWIRR